MRALIIVDVQYDFLPGGALAVDKGDEVIPVINGLQSKFDLVVATQDWHPPDHGSFASNHQGKKPFEMGTLDEEPQMMWPDHCVQGSLNAGISDALDTDRIETIFRKGTNSQIDSYSGFFDNHHKKSTGLSEYLKGRNISEVYVSGLAGDYCVYFTAKDALEEGFKSFLIEDATRALDAQKFASLKADFQTAGGFIVNSSQV